MFTSSLSTVTPAKGGVTSYKTVQLYGIGRMMKQPRA